MTQHEILKKIRKKLDFFAERLEYYSKQSIKFQKKNDEFLNGYWSGKEEATKEFLHSIRIYFSK